MSKIRATVGILTYNCEETLGRTLESVKDFDEIIICDGGSTDGTLEIAGQFCAKVIEQSEEFKNEDGTLKDYSGPRNQMLDAAINDWFLYIDSDEVASKGLIEEIDSIIQNPESRILIYKVPMRIKSEEKEYLYSSNYPGYQTRFFNKKSGSRFQKPVHERIFFDDNFVIGTLKNPWYVHMTRDEMQNYLDHNRKYVDMDVRKGHSSFWKYLHKGVFLNLLNALKAFLKALKNYVLHGTKNTVPWSLEWGRISYSLVLVLGHTKRRLSK